MYGFYTSRSFQGYQEHKSWSWNKEVMQVPKLEENQQTLQHLQQERLLYFDVFRHNISSYCINPCMDRFYTSISFQRYQEHPNQSSDDKVMVLRSWSKNRKAAATSRRYNVETLEHRDVGESCRNAASRHRVVAKRRHNVRGRFWMDF